MTIYTDIYGTHCSGNLLLEDGDTLRINPPVAQGATVDDENTITQANLVLSGAANDEANGDYGTPRGICNGYPYWNKEGEESDPEAATAISAAHKDGSGRPRLQVGGLSDFYGATQPLENYEGNSIQKVLAALADLIDDNSTLPAPTVSVTFLLRKATLAEMLETAVMSKLVLAPGAFADLPADPFFGMIAAVSDSVSQEPGEQVVGGGGNQVIAWYNGSDEWRVMGGNIGS